MKLLFSTIPVIAFFFLYSATLSQVDDEGSLLVNCTASALKTKSDPLIRSCAARRADLQMLNDLSMRKNPEAQVPPLEIVEISMSDGITRAFELTLEQGIKSGISWENIAIIGFEMEMREKEFEEIAKAGLTIHLTDGKSTFDIKIPSCMKFNGKWKLMSGPNWYGVLK